MRLKLLLGALVLIGLGGSYFYGHNKGALEERAFTKEVILPLCYIMTPNVKEELAVCLEQNL